MNNFRDFEAAPFLPKLTLPDAFQFLFEPARYKIGYGGRGAAKSWSYAQALTGLSTIYNPDYSQQQIDDISYFLCAPDYL